MVFVSIKKIVTKNKKTLNNIGKMLSKSSWYENPLVCISRKLHLLLRLHLLKRSNKKYSKSKKQVISQKYKKWKCENVQYSNVAFLFIVARNV